MATNGRTPIDWDEVRKLALSGLSGVEISRRIGVHYITLYNRCKDETGQSWMDLRVEVRREWGEVAENALLKAVKNGDVRAIIFAAKAWAGLKDGRELTHKTETGGIKIEVVSADDDDDGED